MKKLFFFFMALLFGSSLAWGVDVRIHGTITVPANLPDTLKVWVGNASSAQLKVIALPAASYDFTASVNAGSNVYFNLGGSSDWALYPDGDKYRTQDFFFETEDGLKNRFYLRLVDPDNPFESEPNKTDYTVNLKIVPKGGGGDDTPKATLIGRVDKGLMYGMPDCLSGVSVQITKGEYSAQTTTQEMNYDKYYSKLSCTYGYEFTNLELGTYVLTYSKDGYYSKTQNVEITAAGEKIAPAVTLEAKPAEYIFEGTISYLDADNTPVLVEGAQITAYDGVDASAQVLGTTYTDEQGRWSMSLECAAGAAVYFSAEHPNIETIQQRFAGYAVYLSGNMVNISCKQKIPDFFSMATYKVKQIGGADDLRVEVSWTWPQELIDDYMTEEGKGIYRISSIRIMREMPNDLGWSDGQAGDIIPAQYELPATSFVDSSQLATRTFHYHFEVIYSHPALGTVSVPNDEILTITLTQNVVKRDSVTLTLNVNDAAMGTVTGAGKYEKGDMVVIKAQPKSGYRFVAWKEGDNTVASTPQHTVILNENKTLTAFFEPKPVVLDSVILALEVNNPQWGTVQGAGKYAKGDEVTIKAEPADGYKFKQWKSGNVILSSKPQYTFVLNTDSTVTAMFERQIVYRGMTNCSAKQIQGGETPSVRLSWQWPEALIEDYVTADGTGVYEISRIEIRRLSPGSTYADAVGTIRPESNTLPATSFVDTGSANYPLEAGKTYTYSLLVTYSQPAVKEVAVKDDAALTVTIAEDITPVEYVTLTLQVDADRGSVVGAGQYEKNATAQIIATPNQGYVFDAWMENGAVLARTATYQVQMNTNRTITAQFNVAPPVVPDSVVLTLVADAQKGTVTGAGKYQKGQSVAISATPNKGYRFESWQENGNPVSTKAAYTITSLTADRTLTAVFAENIDSVTLTLAPNDPAMGSVQGAGKFAKGKTITIKAIPVDGYIFNAWKTAQGILSRDAEHTFAITTNLSLIAEFVAKVDSATVTLTVNDNAMGYTEGTGKYVKGSNVTIKATPRARHGFEAWKAGQTVIATTPEYTFRLDSDTNLTAVFYAFPDSVTLTLVADERMGTVQGAGRYPKNGQATAKAIAKPGYEFKAWKANDVNISRSAEYTFEITEDLTLTAEFVSDGTVIPDSATLTLTVNDDKMGKVEGAGKYEKGQEVTIKAVANDGYKFRAWMEGENVFATTPEYKFILNTDSALTAVFEANDPVVVKDSVELKLILDDPRMGTLLGAGKYQKGEEVTIKAIANAGYRFMAWMSEDYSIITTTAEYKVVLNSDTTFAALFLEETANEDREQASWSISAENQTIVLRSNAACQYEVYNMAGALVKRAKTNANEYRIAVNNSGLYVVRRLSATGYSVKKVVVR